MNFVPTLEHPRTEFRLFLPLLIACGVSSIAATPPAAPPLMPLPAHLTMSAGRLRIDASFRLALTGYREPRLDRAVTRFLLQLEKQTGLPLSHTSTDAVPAPALIIACDHAGKPVQTFGEDESYRLTVAVSGAHLTAPQPLGILHGLATLLQLVQPGPDGFDIPALEIDDQPRFPWRGLSYDVARHFMPVDQVKRTLDGMAAVKFNVFHWHLSDNQGFRVESRLFPRLQTAGSGGQFYTQAEVRDVVAYARDRGIRVVPEFDIPGHATAMLVAYPELAVEPAPREIDHLFGVLDPVLDPTKPAVYLFLDRFLGEMAALFPDAYMHIGGDENNGRMWRQSVSIQQFKQAQHLAPTAQDPDANLALHAWFNKRLQVILKKHGKLMEGWDEILSPNLPKDIVIQSWRGQKSLGDAVRLGYQGILSSGYYVDLAQPAAEHYAVDPLVDPVTKQPIILTPEEQTRVLGGEAAMWSEWVTPETMDTRVWPRTAVIAERLWSPQDVTDVPSMYRRLDFVSRQLEWAGLTHRSAGHLMLQRLAGTQDVEPLQTFAEMLEPVKGYDRESFGPYTTSTPLIRLVDAIPPESSAALRFSAAVDDALKNHGPWDDVRLQLMVWHANQARLGPVLAGNELLANVSVVAANAFGITGLALDVADALSTGRAPGAAWKQEKLASLRTLAVPEAAVQIAITPAISKLIAALPEQY